MSEKKEENKFPTVTESAIAALKFNIQHDKELAWEWHLKIINAVCCHTFPPYLPPDRMAHYIAGAVMEELFGRNTVFLELDEREKAILSGRANEDKD